MKRDEAERYTSLDSASCGILYIVWGSKVDRYVDRSISSVKLHHPELPIHVHRVESPDAGRELISKSRMASITPFKVTLYLDADTIVMGNLAYGFKQAQRFGLACSISECPWLRRYGQSEESELVEYNTGVLFYTSSAALVFSTWEQLARSTPASSRWTTMDDVPRGLTYDDQASFARAVNACSFNPFILPLNYNLRPDFFRSAFAPVKIWHDYRDPPSGLAEMSLACEHGKRPVTFFDMSIAVPHA